VPVIADQRLAKMIIIGPVFTSETSRELIIDYARSYNILTYPIEMMMNALSQSLVYPYVDFAKLVSAIYYFFYREELDVSLLSIAGLTKDNFSAMNTASMASTSESNHGNSVDTTYSFEMIVMECVQQGNLERLKRYLKTYPYQTIRQVKFSDDPIRRQKDMFIVINTLVTRAALAGGLQPDIAYSLNDVYVQQVESMKTMLPIITLTRNMMHDFTGRVGMLKRTREYSKVVNDCCNYINEHVYELLRVNEIAAMFGYNPNYIAKKFKDETGQTIGTFIRDAKISEAKSLLKYSTLSLADISEQLAFSSQSFFTYTFHQVTGVTPGQYREQAEACSSHFSLRTVPPPILYTEEVSPRKLISVNSILLANIRRVARGA
jgi:AraC-like DNA-binding protein